ncbi:LOW QUALITY PROTEIN: hypothetical protein SBY92_003003 [Candida maltosa Xu316]
MSEQDESVRSMQIKILYSLDTQPNVYLSRSENTLPVKTVKMPLGPDEHELITLGGLELKACVEQVVKSAPETFNLDLRDFEVYYQDISEQPDEPFVANGVISNLLKSNESCLVPGRTLGASSIFGNKSRMSAEILEIRMQLRTIQKQIIKEKPAPPQQQQHQSSQPRKAHRTSSQYITERKRALESASSHYSSNYPAAKATRTLSLPSFPNPSSSSRHRREKVEERFKNAPFFSTSDKVTYETPKSHHSSSNSSSSLQPQRASRTRSMITSNFPNISSPINEEPYSDDPDYNVIEDHIPNEDDESIGETSSVSSPFTPQQPPYKPPTPTQLPDDLDSLRNHTIQSSKLPKNHGLVCINECCRTNTSVNWRYFEIEYRSEYSKLLTANKFDKKNYEGMLGPLCNACFLFYKNKGFMRPEHVVRKYIHQQRYNAKIRQKQKDEAASKLDSVAMKKFSGGTSISLTSASPSGNFPAPTHTPSAINQVIQNKASSNFPSSAINYDPTPPGFTPDYNDLLHQINVYGGPSTDIDPLPGATPPMLATKSNTRVINVEEVDKPSKATKLNTRVINIPSDDENKENCPPPTDPPIKDNDYDVLLTSLHESNGDWMNFFSSPKNGTSPNSKTPVDNQNTIDKSPTKLFNKSLVNMPSSPYPSSNQEDSHVLNNDLNGLIDMSSFKSSPGRANRIDTGNSVMSYPHKDGIKSDRVSSPTTDFYSNDDELQKRVTDDQVDKENNPVNSY